MQSTQSGSPKKRFIESSSFYTNCQEGDPFAKMKINDYTFLEIVPTRSNCPKCNRSRKYYCYTCYVAVHETAERLPIISLPIKIDIIKHPKEVDGKSTAAHAAVLAPNDVTVYTYPDFPSYNKDEVVLIFPSESALPFQEWWHTKTSHSNKKVHNHNYGSELKNSSGDIREPEKFFNVDDTLKNHHQLKTIIFIDSTWRQSKALYSDPRLKGLQCVILNSRKSLFWRPQRGKPDTYLATVEAVYYFLLEFHQLFYPNQSYKGQYDNLLFFFKYMYFKIKDVYNSTDTTR